MCTTKCRVNTELEKSGGAAKIHNNTVLICCFAWQLNSKHEENQQNDPSTSGKYITSCAKEMLALMQTIQQGKRTIDCWIWATKVTLVSMATKIYWILQQASKTSVLATYEVMCMGHYTLPNITDLERPSEVDLRLLIVEVLVFKPGNKL